MQDLELNYKHFIDHTTVLFGETGSGKSTLMVDILYTLKNHIDQIIVISPMDRQNHTYDKGLVPLPCIHYTISTQLLDDLWERQNALAAVYTKANNSDIIKSLFDKIPSNHIARSAIKQINKKLQTYVDELEDTEPEVTIRRTKIVEMENECKRLVGMIRKHCINENIRTLYKLTLSKEEQFSLKYFNMNPRIVIIFDDCTDLLKKFKSHPIIQKLFYQGRWAYITALIACHTDKALDPELKKNAYVSMFTEDSCAHAYFERKTNDLDKDAKTRAMAACKAAFTPLAKHQKLVWIREEKKFYKFTAEVHPDFKFGSDVLWDYCNRIRAKEGDVAMDNKFISNFV